MNTAPAFRPRIKPAHRPVRYGHSQIRIGGTVPGIAADIVDTDGWLWALLECLDGRRTVDQVVAYLVHRWPAHPAAEVQDAIGDLIGAGYIEDAGEPVPPALTPDDLVRYSRSRALGRWWDRTPRHTSWDTQVLLRHSRVVVAGLGGVGCTAALSLALSGVGNLHCVDSDVVERSNLNRQVLYTEADIGRSKAETAVRELRTRNSGIIVTGQRLRIESPHDLLLLAEWCDVLLLAADQPHEIRSWANAACHEAGTAWVHGGYHGPLVNVGLYQPGTGPCYDCALLADRERRAKLPPRTFWRSDRPTDEDVHAANAVTAGLAGQFAALATMSLITGAPAWPVNREFGWNSVTAESGVAAHPVSPRADCPACGNRPPLR